MQPIAILTRPYKMPSKTIDIKLAASNARPVDDSELAMETTMPGRC
jgi:hypothetical protein